MANSKMLNINGEYVKFYITTNSNIPAILQNSGSIVIYHDDGKILSNSLLQTSYGLNYIYFGNEIIASGYGFSSIDLRNKAEEIVVNYDERQDDINGYIKNINDDIYNLKLSIMTYNDNISYTYVTSNESELLNLQKFLFNKINAKYEEAAIIEEKNIIEYYNIVDPYKYWDQYGLTSSYLIKENIISVESYNDEPIRLPIGAKIHSFTKEFVIQMNDESNIENINFLKFSYICQHQIVEQNIDSSFYSQYETTTTLTNSIGDVKIYKIKYVFLSDVAKLDEMQHYVLDGQYDICQDITIQTTGTKSNKQKQYLTDSNKKIYSISKENLILPHTIKLNPIKVIGSSFIYVYQSKVDNDSITFDNIKFGALGNRYLINGNNKITVEKNTSNLYIALPENTVIDEIYYIEKTTNLHVNITGMLVDIQQSRNIVKYPYSTSKYISLFYQYSDLESLNISSIKYKFYLLKYRDAGTFGNNLDIYIKTSNYDKLLFSNVIDNLNSNFYYNNNWISVQNNDYINNNWLNNKTSDTENSFLNMIGVELKYYYTDPNNNEADDPIFNNPIDNWDSLYNLVSNDNKMLLNNSLELIFNSKYFILPAIYAEKCQFLTLSDVYITINHQSITYDKIKILDTLYYRIYSSFLITKIVCNDYFMVYQNYNGPLTSAKTVYDKFLSSAEIMNNDKISEVFEYDINYNALEYIYIYLNPLKYKFSVLMKEKPESEYSEQLKNDILEGNVSKSENEILKEYQLKSSSLKTLEINKDRYSLYKLYLPFDNAFIDDYRKYKLVVTTYRL